MGHSLVSKFFLPLNPQPATVSCGWRANRSADCLRGLCCPVQSCGLEARGRARKLEGLRFRARLSPHCPSLVVSGSPQRPPQTAEMGRWAGDACGTCIHPWSPGAQRLLQSSAHSQGPLRERRTHRRPPDAHISATVDADQACGQIRAFQSPLSRCISAS